MDSRDFLRKRAEAIAKKEGLITTPTETEETVVENPPTEQVIEAEVTPTTETEPIVESTPESSSNQTETVEHPEEESPVSLEVEKEESAPEVDRSLNEDEVFGFLSEKLGREVTSIDELTPQEVSYNSDFAEKYDKYYKETGRPVEDFIFVQKDLSEMSKEDLARENLRRDNPDMTKEDIDFIFKDSYGANEYDDDDDAIRRRDIKLKVEANKGLSALKKEQDKFKLQSNEAPKGFDDYLETQKEEIRSNQRNMDAKWAKELNDSTKDFDGIDLKLANGLDFKFSADKETMKNVNAIVKDTSFTEFLKPYANKEGYVNPSKLHQDIFFLKNKERIIEEATKVAYEAGREAEIRGRVNPEVEGRGSNPTQQNLTDEQKLRNQALNRLYGR